VDARLQRGDRTGCVVVLVGVDGERTMFPDRAAAAELGAVAAQDLEGTTVLHLPLYGFADPRPPATSRRPPIGCAPTEAP
jgi:sugar/nucleoside kinase (ribokinase family)